MNDESEFAVPYQERLQGFANYPLLRSSEVLFRCFDVQKLDHTRVFIPRAMSRLLAQIYVKV